MRKYESVNKVELYTDQGESDPNQTYEVRLSWSDNGGKTFTDTFPRSIGVDGDYAHRTYWLQLGSFPKTRMFALDTAAPSRFSFIKLISTAIF